MTGPLVWTIGGTGVLFLLWAMVSIQHVPLVKLASTSLPHLKTARYLLGDTGRWIMGGIIIFGTLGAVNGLFLACRVNAGEMTGHGLLPQWIKKQGVVPIFLAQPHDIHNYPDRCLFSSPRINTHMEIIKTKRLI